MFMQIWDHQILTLKIPLKFLESKSKMKNKTETILLYEVEVLETLGCSQHKVSFKHSTILFISKSTTKETQKNESQMDRGSLLF